MKAKRFFAVAAALLVGLAVAGCKSKEEKIIDSALDDMEKVVVKCEALAGKLASGEIEPLEFADSSMELNTELAGIMAKPEYAEYQAVLSNVPSWSKEQQERQQALTARMLQAAAAGAAAASE